MAAPGEWLDPDWVMLTTGLRLRGSRQRQVGLVDELCERGIAALGFGTGIVFEAVPAALLEAARARSLPVFEVPRELPFRDIVTAVERQLTMREEPTAQRLLAAQRFLIDALREPHPEAALIARLERQLGGPAFILWSDGAIAGRAPGPDSLRPALARLDEASSATVVWTDRGCEFLAERLEGGEHQPSGWLVSWRSGSLPRGSLSRQLMKLACGPILATCNLGKVERDQRHAVAAAVASELLSGPPSPELLARARALGAGDRAMQVVVIGRADGLARFAPGEAGGLVAELSEGGTCLRYDGPREVVCLLEQRGSALRQRVEALLAGRTDLLAGLGRQVLALAQAHESRRDAELAIRRLRDGAATAGGVLEFGDLDLGEILVCEAPHDRIRPELERILGVLRENRALRDALVGYFEHGMDVAQVAENLCLHPNSIRYRLRRIETLVGGSFKDPATITNLYIALTAEEAGETAGVVAAPSQGIAASVEPRQPSPA